MTVDQIPKEIRKNLLQQSIDSGSGNLMLKAMLEVLSTSLQEWRKIVQITVALHRVEGDGSRELNNYTGQITWHSNLN